MVVACLLGASRIEAVDHAPTASDDRVIVDSRYLRSDGSGGQEYLVVVDVLANDSDADGTPLVVESFSALQAPSPGYLLQSLGEGIFRFIAPSPLLGDATFTYSLKGPPCAAAGSTCTAVVTFTADANPIAVKGVADSFEVAVDLPTPLPVLANDEGAETIASFGTYLDGDPYPATRGTVDVDTSGTQLVYTPPMDFAPGDEDYFHYTPASSLAQGSPTPVEVTGEGCSTLTARDDVATTPSATPVVVDVLLNDCVPPGGTLMIVDASVVPGVTYGYVEIVDEGLHLRYDPLYVAEGPIPISYTIGDGSGGRASAILTVDVGVCEDPPTARFHVACDGRTCNFDGTYSNWTCSAISQYCWTFGDGTPESCGDVGSNAGKRPSHTYPGMGPYTVTLRTPGTHGLADSTSRVVYPEIVVAAFTHVCAAQGMACDFDASASSAELGIDHYVWRFGSGAAPVSVTVPTISHQFPLQPNPALYSVELEVQDILPNSHLATKTVTKQVCVEDRSVGDAPPVASFTYDCQGGVCSFDASASHDDFGIGCDTGRLAAYSWDFGDGTTASGVTAQHEFDRGGPHVVTLSVMDDVGQSGSLAQMLTLPDSAPIPSYAYYCYGLECEFDGSLSVDDYGIVEYRWDFGDGTQANGINAAHTYAAAGTYQSKLTVVDTLGQEHTSQARSVAADVVWRIGGAGTATVDSGGQDVSFSRRYRNPVVFAQPVSEDGSTVAAVARVYDVTRDGFRVKLDAEAGNAGSHTVHYQVFEEGVWQLEGSGTHLEVRKTFVSAAVSRLTSKTWQKVPFSTELDPGLSSTTPVVVAQTQTRNDPAFVSIRQRNIDVSGFELALEGLENATAAHGAETVGWMALRQETVADHDARRLAGVTQAWTDLGCGGAPFQAALSSYAGSNNAHVRYRIVSDDTCTTFQKIRTEVRVEEDHTYDLEMGHIGEEVSYVSFPGNLQTATPSLDPGALDDWAEVSGTTPITIPVLANDVDPRGESLHVAAVTAPLKGTAVINVDGSITYRPSGDYVGLDSFTYTVENDSGLRDGGRARITLLDDPPTPKFSVACTVPTCTFSGYASFDDGGVKSWSWSFEDGSTATGPSVDRTYSHGGSFPVTLTVTDGGGHSESLTKTVVVPDASPVARFTFNCPFASASCSFNALTSTDDYGITSFAWSFGDGTSGTGSQATHTYAASGSYPVRLTVTDTKGQTGSAQQSLTISIPQVMGERGGVTISGSRGSQVVTLSRTYSKPVVFAGILFADDLLGVAVARVSDVTPTSFVVRVDAERYCGTCSIGVTYVVLEQGRWIIEGSGRKLEVGTLTTSKQYARRYTPRSFETVSLASPFINAPRILSQVQTRNDSRWITTRHRNATGSSFELTMSPLEAELTAHAAETIGWLATEEQVGSWGANSYEARRASASGDWSWWGLAGYGYTNCLIRPGFLAEVSSLAEWHGQLMRRGFDTSFCQIELRMQDDTTYDMETLHPAENVDYLAIYGANPLRALPVLP